MAAYGIQRPIHRWLIDLRSAAAYQDRFRAALDELVEEIATFLAAQAMVQAQCAACAAEEPPVQAWSVDEHGGPTSADEPVQRKCAAYTYRRSAARLVPPIDIEIEVGPVRVPAGRSIEGPGGIEQELRSTVTTGEQCSLP